MTLSSANRRLATLAVLLFAMRHSMHGQTTTATTNCNLYGNTANCASTSTTNNTDNRTQAQRNSDAFKAGWERGTEIRAAREQAQAQRAFVNTVNTYCAVHQGQNWQMGGQQGHCQTDDERVTALYLMIESRHHEFNAKDPDNIKTVADYVEDHNYDANSWRGWEKAYKELKKQHKLKLYAKGSY